MSKIYKVMTKSAWQTALADKVFRGAEVDIKDGYIHFSTKAQVEETVAKHFKGQKDLLLVCVDAERLGDALAWEVSRNDDLFPHLYAELDVSLADTIYPLTDRGDGGHDFPENY